MYVHQHFNRVQINKMKPSIGLRKGAWTAQEDMLLKDCIEKHGEGKWHLVPLKAGLNRCRKSCRLRWLNYLRPNIKRGEFGEDEVDLMLRLHKLLGNKWSLIAGRIPERTANDVKNYWNTHLRSHSRKQKKESSNDDKSLRHIKVTIFKPQPRTFSKTVNCHTGDKPHIMTRSVTSLIRSSNDGANDFNVHSGLISSPNILDHKINELEYLDDLLNDSEKETEDQNGWLFGGPVVDGEALNGVEQEGGQNDLCDFGIDDFTWTLFDSDQL